MSSKSLNRQAVDWKEIYRRSHRPVKPRGLSNPYFTFRTIGLFAILLPFVLYTLARPGVKMSEDLGAVLIYPVFLVWLAWSLWPMVENQWASRFVVRAHIERKPGATFWQGDGYPIEIIIHEAFKITSKGMLIQADDWIGRCRLSIPVSLYDQVHEKEELVLLCFSTRKIVKILKDFSNP